MNKTFRKLSVALCAVITLCSIAPFSACNEERAFAVIADTDVKGITLSASHYWDFTSLNGESVVGERSADFVQFTYSFANDKFHFDAYKMTKDSPLAKEEGKAYEGNYFFLRDTEKYLTDTLLVDNIKRVWTWNDVLYALPLFGTDALNGWFGGVNAIDLADRYESPEQFSSLALRRIQTLAYAVQKQNLGSFYRDGFSYRYDMDVYSLYSPWVTKRSNFIDGLNAQTTVGEMLSSDYYTEYFNTFYAGYSSQEFLSELRYKIKKESLFGKLTVRENFAFALENFPEGKKNEKVGDYISRLVTMPLSENGFTLGKATLADLFYEEEFLEDTFLVERLKTEFVDSWENKLKTRFFDFDDFSLSLCFDVFGNFQGIDWYKMKQSDFAGLYTTTNEYVLSIRFLTRYPKLSDLTYCQVKKIDNIEENE